MSWYEGMAIDPEAARACAERLVDAAEAIGGQHRHMATDTVSTITVNGNISRIFQSLNENRGILGDYLTLDDENFEVLVEILTELDVDMAGEY